MQKRQLPFFLGDTSHSCLVLIIQLISQKDREIQQVSGEIRYSWYIATEDVRQILS